MHILNAGLSLLAVFLHCGVRAFAQSGNRQLPARWRCEVVLFLAPLLQRRPYRLCFPLEKQQPTAQDLM